MMGQQAGDRRLLVLAEELASVLHTHGVAALARAAEMASTCLQEAVTVEHAPCAAIPGVNNP